VLIRSRSLAVCLVAGGGLSIAGGVALVDAAAGLVVAGVEAVVAGMVLVDVDEKPRRRS